YGEEAEKPEPPEITIPPEWVPGVYANAAQATFTEHEFTIDFIRMDPYYNSGVVVARISCSPQAVNDFALHLTQLLRIWADQVMSNLGGDGNGQTAYGPEGSGPEPPA